MTTMTFESISISPRRAAARRSARPAPRVVAAVKPQAAIALIRTSRDANGLRNKGGLIALTVLAVALHGAIYVAINRGGPVAPVVAPITPPLAIDIAPPPPPPPPVIQPKPLPQIAKPVAAPVKAAPPLPVVKSAAVDTTEPTPDTVQVATAPTTAPPGPAPAPVAAPVERVTEPRGFAGYKNNPIPSYPPAAQNRHMEGSVVLNVHVLANGQADEVKILKSSDHQILDDAAAKTVATWIFDPAKRGDTPVDAWVHVPINFKL